MGCEFTGALTGINFACEDVASGGVKRLYVALKQNVKYTDDGSVTTIELGDNHILGPAESAFVEIQFNNKDQFTYFGDVKTTEATGTSVAVPTIAVELPRMSREKRNELEVLTSPGIELVALVEAAAGTYHFVGGEFGLYGSSVDGATGTQRSDKNRYQLTLTGEENSLALSINQSEFDAAIALAGA